MSLLSSIGDLFGTADKGYSSRANDENQRLSQQSIRATSPYTTGGANSFNLYSGLLSNGLLLFSGYIRCRTII